MLQRAVQSLWLSGCLWLVASTAAAEPRVAGELALESKLMAPCCWVQTLDMHDSPLATELRAEIRGKLARGVPADAIGASLAERYGGRIWAIPPGRDPRSSLVQLSFGALAFTLLGLFAVARRWRRKSATPAEPAPSVASATGDAALDQRLDRELGELDA